jgi:hypothetical protein
MTKLEQVARAIEVEFVKKGGVVLGEGTAMEVARSAVEALRGAPVLGFVWDENRLTDQDWNAALDAILSEKPDVG